MDLPRTYLTNAEAAQYLRLSPRTLEKMRGLGNGPRFRKFGHRVLYELSELETWAADRSYATTSEIHDATARGPHAVGRSRTF